MGKTRGGGARRLERRALRAGESRNENRAGRSAMKYRYVITYDGVVEADSMEEAELAAYEQVENGAGYVTGCDIEPLTRETEV